MLILTLVVLDIHQIILKRHAIYRIWLHIKPFLTWRIIVCYLPWWFLATGWAWLGSVIGHGWFKAISLTWLGFLWMPFSEEKLITIPLTIWLHKKLFPHHSVPKVLENKKTRE